MLYGVFADGRVDELPEATHHCPGWRLTLSRSQWPGVQVFDRLAVLMFGHDDRVKLIAERIRAER
jgi:hypothetical protein